jgi:hypothetical protein
VGLPLGTATAWRGHHDGATDLLPDRRTQREGRIDIVRDDCPGRRLDPLVKVPLEKQSFEIAPIAWTVPLCATTPPPINACCRANARMTWSRSLAPLSPSQRGVE